MKKKKWHDNDWLVCLATAVVMVAVLVAHYFYHGGRLVW